MSTVIRPPAQGSAAPTFDQGIRLGRIVPDDVFVPIRSTLVVLYGIGYLVWLRTKGLPIDRISVALSVALFLGCAFVGRPRHIWRQLAIDSVLYSAMWLAYERSRGIADSLGFPVQVQSVRNIDRFLFFGHDPNVVLQDHFWSPAVRWYDKVASVTYYTHFVLPVVALAALWAISHYQWVRFMKRFATLLGVACVMFVLLPTAPPWMVAQKYHLIDHVNRGAGRGFSALGFKGFVKSWTDALGDGNAIAAMPSLHASFALIVPAFFLPWIKPKWLKVLVLLFPVVMLTSLVYLAEHWVIDGMIGWVIVAGSFWFWRKMESRQRRQRATRARVALAGLA